MKDLVTILIPSHNRQRYLDRILDYYDPSGLRIIVADSTGAPYRPVRERPAVQYLHLPGISLPGKLERALGQVRTPFVVMCADDDFLIPGSVAICVDFLCKHEDFAAAQGNAITYKMEGDEIDLRLLYPNLPLPFTLEIGMEEISDRLEKMFSAYKSFFYAVFRTSCLSKAFKGLDDVITNPYLNEYVTGVIPLVYGKYVELPILYHVREYSETSDDKITPSLSRIFDEEGFTREREAWLDYLADAVADGATGPDRTEVRARLSALMQKFAGQIREMLVPRVSRKKALGRIVAGIPALGPWLIKTDRRREAAKRLSKIIQKPDDRQALDVVLSFIRKYARAIARRPEKG